jgi:hypothetical protein
MEHENPEPSNLRICLPSSLFPFSFTRILQYSFYPPIVYATYPANPIQYDLIIVIVLDEEYKLWGSSLY